MTSTMCVRLNVKDLVINHLSWTADVSFIEDITIYALLQSFSVVGPHFPLKTDD